MRSSLLSLSQQKQNFPSCTTKQSYIKSLKALWAFQKCITMGLRGTTMCLLWICWVLQLKICLSIADASLLSKLCLCSQFKCFNELSTFINKDSYIVILNLTTS